MSLDRLTPNARAGEQRWLHPVCGDARCRRPQRGGLGPAVDHPASLMFASLGIGLLTLRQGGLPRALPRLERAVGLCQDGDYLIYFPRGAAYTLCWLAAWRRHRPSASVRWRSPASTRNAATRRMRCASLATLRHGAIPRRAHPP